MATAVTVTYVSENDREYAASLKRAQTFEKLKEHARFWRRLAADAFEAVNSNSFDWNEFQKGRKQENQDIFAGEEWSAKYGAILMPEILMRVSIYAMQLGAPWGCVYIRLRDMGNIIEVDGVATWKEDNDGESKAN